MPFPIRKPDRKIDWSEEAARREPGERAAQEHTEIRARFEHDHACMTCAHLTVCKLGRMTAEAFAEGWLAVIGACSEHVPASDES